MAPRPTSFPWHEHAAALGSGPPRVASRRDVRHELRAATEHGRSRLSRRREPPHRGRELRRTVRAVAHSSGLRGAPHADAPRAHPRSARGGLRDAAGASEQTAGRPLAERTASEHRYDLIEDIAASMPEVAAWVASSGLTLDEIASIQPGYIAPNLEMWRPLDLGKMPIPDGPVDLATKDGRVQGELESAQMEGHWTRKDAQQVECVPSAGRKGRKSREARRYVRAGSYRRDVW